MVGWGDKDHMVLHHLKNRMEFGSTIKCTFVVIHPYPYITSKLS